MHLFHGELLFTLNIDPHNPLILLLKVAVLMPSAEEQSS